jgi:hypothetical protein
MIYNVMKAPNGHVVTAALTEAAQLLEYSLSTHATIRQGSCHVWRAMSDLLRTPAVSLVTPLQTPFWA